MLARHLRSVFTGQAGEVWIPARFTCATTHDPRSGYFQECPVIALTFGCHPVRTCGQFPG